MRLRGELEAGGNPEGGGALGQDGVEGAAGGGEDPREDTPRRGGIPSLGYGSFSGNRRQQGGDFQWLRPRFHCRGHRVHPWLGNQHPTCHTSQVKGMREGAAGVAQMPEHR